MKIKLLALLFFGITFSSWGQLLKTEGKKIVDNNGEEVILRGMGLGGWMLMEGYMMQSSDVADTQHEFRERLEELIGEDKTNEFFDTWLANHVTKKDIDSLAKWGFNSVRLPMHYNLFTLPIEDETVSGQNTWLDKGFEMVDDLLGWCESNNMYLILDLHAAPGGQGANAAISDYDPDKPSLWESDENKSKTVALWKKLAERYKDEAWIGGYDLLNEVNWSLPGNTALKELYIDITEAIREVDSNHIIFIEGNDFANNFTGLTPAWDDNMVYSFHKYWSFNDKSSIQWVLDLRENTNVPLWMGEGGENSNVWFNEAVELFEEHNIGWSWWPMKRVETIVGPYSIKFTEGYKNILRYWRGEVSKPSVNDAFDVMMELANNTNSSNCIYNKDVPDVLIRQTNNSETIPYSNHTIPGVVHMSDFDLGRLNEAYFDQDYANYGQSTGSFQAWNNGWIYRNDGVDIQENSDDVNSNGYHVGFANKDEWMNYTVNISESGMYKANVRLAAPSEGGQFHLELDGEEITTIQTTIATGGWNTFESFEVPNINLEAGKKVLKFYFDGAIEFNLSSIEFTKTGNYNDGNYLALNGHTASNNLIEISLNQNVLKSSINESKDDFTLFINGEENVITSVSSHSTKNKTIVIESEQTLVYTDEIKVSYSGSQIESSEGKTLEAFSELEVRNILTSIIILPGRLEVEDYVAMEGLGIEDTTDAGGGKNIGYTDTGDYADYIIYSSENSTYKVDFRFAGFDEGEIGLYLVQDDSSEAEIMTIKTPITNGWQNWETVSGEVAIPEGIHKLRMKIITGGFNMNWMEFELIGTNDDLDGDGVKNDVDECPNTEEGATVDATGCAIFALPVDNFTFEVKGETCPDRENGKIEISVMEEHSYKMSLIGEGLDIIRSFNNGINLNGLKPGNYTACITVDGEDFEQCFELTIAEGITISGKVETKSKEVFVQINKGTAPFEIYFNNELLFETNSNAIFFNVENTGDLVVKTAVECEGILKKNILIDEVVSVYPNPSNGYYELQLQDTIDNVFVEVFNIMGQRVQSNIENVNGNKIQVNIKQFPAGIYFVKLNLEKPLTVKVIKK